MSEQPFILSKETLSVMEEIAEQLPSGFVLYREDAEREILFVNRALLDLFDCATEEEFRALTGNSFNGMVHPEDFEQVQKSIDAQIAGTFGAFDHVEYRIRTARGAVRWIDDYGHFSHSEEYGEVFYVFLFDITEKMLARSAKSQFYYDMSHRLLTPMNAVSTFIKLALRHRDDPAAMERFLRDADEAAGFMTGEIDALVEVHRRPVSGGKKPRRRHEGPLRVLIAEDNELNRMLLQMILEESGFEVEAVDDGDKAVEAVRAGGEGKFDTVLMDIQMPAMDGCEAARQIRAIPWANAEALPILAISANSREEDIDASLESGMNAHMAKPYDPDQIVEAIHRYTGTEAEQEPESPAAPEESAYARMERENLTYAALVEALASDFICFYYVNTETDAFLEFSAGEDPLGLELPKAGDFSALVEDTITPLVYYEDRDAFCAAFNKENLLRVLREDRAFSLTFRLQLADRLRYVRLKASRVTVKDSQHIVIGVSDVDAQTRRQAEYEAAQAEHLTYARISEALAADYFCTYYVDTLTGAYEAFNPSALYKSLGLADRGEDVYGDPKFLSMVCEEDLEAYRRLFNRENVTRELQTQRSFSMIYRVMLAGTPTYIQMKATRMLAEDDHHIIVGLSNVDARVRRDEELTRALSEARAIADRDPLTGVKSKHAFAESEREFDRRIAEDSLPEFCVLVCDVNGLKTINDTQGHKAGDAYIRAASALICGIFKRSPVFRVGGDEFVVLPRGKDFENRGALLGELNRAIEENQVSGGVVIAVGAADYERGQDKSVNAVFERADAAMYSRKKQLKGGAEPR